MTNTVATLIEYHGSLYAGGFIVRAGDTEVNGVARWTGTSWEAMGRGMRRHDCPSVGTCVASVSAFVVWEDRLVAGGRFTIAGGDAAQSIAFWDGAIWHPLGAGFETDVRALAVWRGQLVAGGDFQKTGSDSVAHVAVWSGSQWLPLGPGTDGPVTSLAEFQGELFVAGHFARAGTQPADDLARWDGTEWRPVPLASDYDYITRWLAASGSLYGVGFAAESGSENPIRYGLLQWQDGVWRRAATDLPSEPMAAACEIDGGLMLAGFGGRPVLWRVQGTHAEHVSSFLSNDVLALCAWGGSVFAGGQFQRAGDRPSRYMARWDP